MVQSEGQPGEQGEHHQDKPAYHIPAQVIWQPPRLANNPNLIDGAEGYDNNENDQRRNPTCSLPNVC